MMWNFIMLGYGVYMSLKVMKFLIQFHVLMAEFDVSDIPRRNKTVLILRNQSGETKDLHRCIDIARTFDLITIGVVNTADSMIARETDCGVYLNAGREVAVASTKSFTSQCIILTLIVIWFAQNKGIHIKKRQKAIHDLRNFSFN